MLGRTAAHFQLYCSTVLIRHIMVICSMHGAYVDDQNQRRVCCCVLFHSAGLQCRFEMLLAYSNEQMLALIPLRCVKGTRQLISRVNLYFQLILELCIDRLNGT